MPDLELELILRAQDRMSAELRAVQTEMQSFQAQAARINEVAGQVPTSNVISQLGADAQRTQVQVDAFSASLGRIKDYALGSVMAQAVMPAVEALKQIPSALIDTNSQLEQATTSFRVFTGSADKANQIVQELRQNANITPFVTSQIVQMGQMMMPFTQGSPQALMDFVRTGEILAAMRPTEGVLGATMAMQEAQGGIFTSAERRFGIPRDFINQAKETTSGVDVLTAALNRMGVGWNLVTEQGKTWTGVTSTITSQMEQLTQEVGAGAFGVLKGQLLDVNAGLLENRASLDLVANALGSVLGEGLRVGLDLTRQSIGLMAEAWNQVALAAEGAARAEQEAQNRGGNIYQQVVPSAAQTIVSQAAGAVGRAAPGVGQELLGFAAQGIISTITGSSMSERQLLNEILTTMTRGVDEAFNAPSWAGGWPIPHDLGGGPLAFPTAAGPQPFGQAYIAQRQQEEAASVDVWSRIMLPGDHFAPAGMRSMNAAEGGVPAAQAFVNLKTAADEASAALKSIGEQHTRAQGFLGDAQAAIAIYKQAGQAIPPELLKFQQTMMLDTRTLTIQKAFADVGAWQASGGQTAFLAQTVAINAQIVNVQGLNAQGQNDTGAGFFSSGSGPDRGDRPGASAVAAAAAPTPNVIHVHPVASPSHAKYVASRSQGAGGQPHR